ncbi:MAG: hypothetical protein EA338_10545 [Roseinatronobacter sp.]|nr:MAG: hypothetical protein EA338_10545 [Roseinatronobacter sp.]
MTGQVARAVSFPPRERFGCLQACLDPSQQQGNGKRQDVYARAKAAAEFSAVLRAWQGLETNSLHVVPMARVS